MLFTSTKDWKQYLSAEDEEKLNELLKRVSRHRGAYKNADEIKIAQLWCAFLEARSENVTLKKRLERLEYLLEGTFSRVREEEREKNRTIESLEKF